MTRTRFAMCPQKKMDVNDLRDALFSYLIAKHDGGEFVLRIDDANQNLYHIDAEENIYYILGTFGLSYDEGPKKEKENVSYIQSEHLLLYKNYAEKLVKRGKAYYCFCTKEELNKRRIEDRKNNASNMEEPCRDFPKDEARRKILIEEKYVIRASMPKLGQTSFHDVVYKDITTANEALEDPILIKSDGTPTYNFAGVLDDALLNITHTTSSAKFLPSTAKYLLLYEDLGFPVPEFIHFPEIITSGKDLLTDLLEQGFLKEAILNYIAVLNWTPKDNKEFFTLEELIQEFDVEKIHRKPVHFDLKKLEWFNRHYIRKMSDTDYLEFMKPYLEKAYSLEGKKEEWINHLLLLYKNRLNFASEIAFSTHLFFASEIEYDEEQVAFLKSDASIENTLRVFKKEIEKLNNWNLEEIKITLENVEKEASATGRLLYLSIRIAITGTMQGPNLIEVIYLLGKDTILKRLGE